MNFRGKGRGRRAETAMDITSLVDVVFLLLIFLLVTTTFKKDEYAFQIELPTSSADEVTVTTDRTTVFVDTNGDLHLLTVPADGPDPTVTDADAQKVTRKELSAKLRELHARRPDASIAIRGEKTTSYQTMVEVVGAIQDAGFRNIWFPYEFGQDAPAPGPAP